MSNELMVKLKSLVNAHDDGKKSKLLTFLLVRNNLTLDIHDFIVLGIQDLWLDINSLSILSYYVFEGYERSYRKF